MSFGVATKEYTAVVVGTRRLIIASFGVARRMTGEVRVAKKALLQNADATVVHAVEVNGDTGV
jgi:hypothetical protein